MKRLSEIAISINYDRSQMALLYLELGVRGSCKFVANFIDELSAGPLKPPKKFIINLRRLRLVERD